MTRSGSLACGAVGSGLFGCGLIGDALVHQAPTFLVARIAPIVGSNGEWAHLATGVGLALVLFVVAYRFLLAPPSDTVL